MIIGLSPLILFTIISFADTLGRHILSNCFASLDGEIEGYNVICNDDND